MDSTERDNQPAFNEPRVKDIRDTRRLYEQQKFQRWFTQAKTLTAHNVHIAPAYAAYNERLNPNIWGAFWDSEQLAKNLADSTNLYRAHEPLVMFAYEVDINNLTCHHPHLPGHDLWAVATQSAGMACHHRYLIGIPLALHDSGSRTAAHIAHFANRDRHNCVGLGGHNLSDLADYHQHLADCGMSAEWVWDRLEEAVYPLDRHCAAALSDTPVPDDEKLCGPNTATTGKEQILETFTRIHAPKRWAVYILGDNCD